MPTGLSYINDAFEIAGIYAPGETPTADEANGALRSMNDMLASWSAELSPVFCQRHDVYQMTASVAHYTIGPTGTFVQPRPNKIQNAMVRVQGNLDYPLQIITPAEYQGLNLKTLTGIPQYLAVNPTMPNLELSLYYVPQQSYELNLNTLISLDSQTLNGEVEFPPGYEEAVKYNLALRLAGKYGAAASMSQFNIDIAIQSKKTIKRENDMMLDDQMNGDLSAPGLGVVNFPWWWTGGANPG